MKDLSFAPASERNKHPILEQLKQWLPVRGRLLEIGSGTGQHAVFFSAAIEGLQWQSSERQSELPGLRARLAREGNERTPPPICLDVLSDPWPDELFQAVYSANTAHIMSWGGVCALFEGVGRVLVPGGPFVLYGPFNVNGRFTAPSNEEFDGRLRSRDAEMGLRDMADLERLASRQAMTLEQKVSMPANNFLLVFRR